MLKVSIAERSNHNAIPNKLKVWASTALLVGTLAGSVGCGTEQPQNKLPARQATISQGPDRSSERVPLTEPAKSLGEEAIKFAILNVPILMIIITTALREKSATQSTDKFIRKNR
jgi:hypothetical protein